MAPKVSFQLLKINGLKLFRDYFVFDRYYVILALAVVDVPLAEHIGAGVAHLPSGPHSTTPLKSYPPLQVTEAFPAYTVSPLKTPFGTVRGPQSK